jgi:hypothetical protein
MPGEPHADIAAAHAFYWFRMNVYKGQSLDSMRYFAAGTAVASPARGGSDTILVPMSFRSR